MNRIYRLVFNAASGIWMAVAETAKGRGKSCSGQKLVAAALSLTGGLFLAPFAAAEPVGGVVSAGSGSIAKAGTTTTINQSSANLSINWQSFSIGANEAVRFNQPSASSVALNRVVGQSPSQILGSLSANGQVFVLNPNGVLFGNGSQVNVGGLVASTLSLADADLMAGKFIFTSPPNIPAGTVVNQGTLTAAQGGYIALLAPEVRNEGVISATLGTALLAAGNKVTLNLNSGSLLSYTFDEGALNALADNKQLIKADGGQVFMSAKAANALSTAVVNNTGVIEARTLQNRSGKIWLISDVGVGTANIGGKLDASAPNGGDGGFIETSAAHVKIAEGAKVTTAAVAGKTGEWLIDPTDFTIATTGNISGANLSIALISSDVTVLSSNGSNTTTGFGDINVNEAVNWSANKLTLTAARSINVNAVMTASGSSTLALNTSTANGGATAISGGSINMGFNADGTFKGRIDLPTAVGSATGRSGTGIVSINGVNQTVINSLASLQSIRNDNSSTLTGNYVVGFDIDAISTKTSNPMSMSGPNPGQFQGFKPIGGTFVSGAGGIYSNTFVGTFNGFGHTISDLYVNRQISQSGANNYAGLFGYIDGGTVNNIGLVRADIKGINFTGGIVGYLLNGSLSNTFASGKVEGVSYIGGIAGLGDSYQGNGSIKNSFSTASVTGSYDAGGIVGHNDTIISNSYYDVENVKINGVSKNTSGGISNAQYVRWLAGNQSLTISDYFGLPDSTGAYKVTSVNDLKNMLAFSQGNYKFIQTNNIDFAGLGEFYIPYFSGTYDGGSKTISNAKIDRTADKNIGLFGHLRGTVKNLGVENINVKGSAGVGGLVGFAGKGSSINNSYITGTVEGISRVGGGPAYAGGVVGELRAGTLKDSYATVIIKSNSSGAAGGIVGKTSLSPTISRSYAFLVNGSNTSAGIGGGGGDGTNKTFSNANATSGKQVSTFWSWGNNINNTGTNLDGTTPVAGGVSTTPWRIYEGNTFPLLTSFMTVYDPTVTTTYTGVQQSSTAINTLPLPLFGIAATGTNAGTYASNYYSTQQGYNLINGSKNLIIAKAPLTVTANSDSTKTYTGLSQSFSGVSVTGMVNGEAASLAAPTASGTGVGTNAGNYTVSASAGTPGSNYTVTMLVDGTMVIAKVSITVRPTLEALSERANASVLVSPQATDTLSSAGSNDTNAILPKTVGLAAGVSCSVNMLMSQPSSLHIYAPVFPFNCIGQPSGPAAIASASVR